MSEGILLENEAKQEVLEGVGTVFLALCVGHLVVDSLGTLLPASLGLIEVRSGLAPEQSAWLMGLGSLISGLTQPVCAVISDRYRTRFLSVVGIALAGIGFGFLGLAKTSAILSISYMIGMIGNGMFHPLAATTVAQLYRVRRNSAASTFFVAGMVGGVLGAMLWPRWLSTSAGFDTLPYIAIPCVLLAFVVHRRQMTLPAVRRHSEYNINLELLGRNWKDVGYLYLSSMLRYCVNTALVYLFVRWSQDEVVRLAEIDGSLRDGAWSAEKIANVSAPIIGNLNAAMIFGMAVGGILAGKWVLPNRERLPMIWVPLVFSPVVALFPYMPIWASYILAFLAGIGFSSMIPISIALAQHLLPHRANLASSLMMGGAWTVATVGPPCAEYGVTHLGLNGTFLMTAGVLALSGLTGLGMTYGESRENIVAMP